MRWREDEEQENYKEWLLTEPEKQRLKRLVEKNDSRVSVKANLSADSHASAKVNKADSILGTRWKRFTYLADHTLSL